MSRRGELRKENLKNYFTAAGNREAKGAKKNRKHEPPMNELEGVQGRYKNQLTKLRMKNFKLFVNGEMKGKLSIKEKRLIIWLDSLLFFFGAFSKKCT